MIKERREFHEEVRHGLSGSIEMVTIDRVRRELERLARRGFDSSARLARITLKQIDAGKIRIVESYLEGMDVDSAIVATVLAQRRPVAVATVDRKLRDVLSKHGIMVIHPRKGHGLLISRTSTSVT